MEYLEEVLKDGAVWAFVRRKTEAAPSTTRFPSVEGPVVSLQQRKPAFSVSILVV
jgi:hypothetical protein